MKSKAPKGAQSEKNANKPFRGTNEKGHQGPRLLRVKKEPCGKNHEKRKITVYNIGRTQGYGKWRAGRGISGNGVTNGMSDLSDVLFGRRRKNRKINVIHSTGGLISSGVSHNSPKFMEKKRVTLTRHNYNA